MNITSILDHQWDDVRSTYLEAFPKAERKPFFTVRRSVNIHFQLNPYKLVLLSFPLPPLSK